LRVESWWIGRRRSALIRGQDAPCQSHGGGTLGANQLVGWSSWNGGPELNGHGGLKLKTHAVGFGGGMTEAVVTN